MAGSSNLWIDFLYIILIVPAFLWIGVYEKETSRQAFDFMLLLGFGTLGYNIYELMLQLNTVTGGRDIKIINPVPYNHTFKLP